MATTGRPHCRGHFVRPGRSDLHALYELLNEQLAVRVAVKPRFCPGFVHKRQGPQSVYQRKCPVGPLGFEPRTCGLRVRCSAGLS
jgi:hypothetical protein